MFLGPTYLEQTHGTLVVTYVARDSFARTHGNECHACSQVLLIVACVGAVDGSLQSTQAIGIKTETLLFPGLNAMTVTDTRHGNGEDGIFKSGC